MSDNENDGCPVCGDEIYPITDKGNLCDEFGHGPFDKDELISSEDDYEWVV